MNMPFPFFDSSKIPENLYLEEKISTDDYLSAIKKVAIFAGFFMISGFVLVDYLLLPEILGNNYESWGFYWSVPIAVVISFLFFLIRYRKAKAAIEKHERKSNFSGDQ